MAIEDTKIVEGRFGVKITSDEDGDWISFRRNGVHWCSYMINKTLAELMVRVLKKYLERF